MDFTALSRKLHELDPSTPQEDAAKLKAMATGQPVEEVKKETVTESVARAPIDEVAQFKALAGVNTKAKTAPQGVAAELAALAGIITESTQVVAEKSVSKAQQKAMGAALAAKRGDIPKSELKGASKEMVDMSEKDLEDFAKTKHKGLPEKKKKEESFDAKAFRESFEAMVEAKKMPMGPGPDGKKGTKDDKPAFLNQKTGAKKSKSDKKDDGMTDKQKKYFGKKNESVEEGKYKSDAQRKAIHASKDKKMKEASCSSSMKKKKTNESIEAMQENKPLAFKDLLGIVKESGGQQQIDCVDTTLWTWAQRVANAKYEGTKAEVFAGMLYERNGGRFEMHDVLAEDK
jgi:hypothetical protein